MHHSAVPGILQARQRLLRHRKEASSSGPAIYKRPDESKPLTFPVWRFGKKRLSLAPPKVKRHQTEKLWRRGRPPNSCFSAFAIIRKAIDFALLFSVPRLHSFAIVCYLPHYIVGIIVGKGFCNGANAQQSNRPESQGRFGRWTPYGRRRALPFGFHKRRKVVGFHVEPVGTKR